MLNFACNFSKLKVSLFYCIHDIIKDIFLLVSLLIYINDRKD